ncbi:MAG: hypothetical protein HYU64_17955 [Armatimonadetes bacterium]|nr:hypothetical protein [Armatimonadota bacterium]
MNIERHLEILEECFSGLQTCVDGGIEKNQRIIGFLTSLGAAEMLELYLHKKNLFSLSFRINHAWLKSQKKLKEKIPWDFPQKDKIIQLAYYIEKGRDELCYGKRLERERIKEQIEHFYKLRDALKEVGLDEIP